MSNKQNKAYQKHLTLLNREDIEKLLKLDFKFYQIANNIQKLDLCVKLIKPPYVCNACNSYAQCRKIKYIYIASEAQKNMNQHLLPVEWVLTFQKKNFKNYTT